MSSIFILLKYYGFCLLLGVIFGFNQYAFKINIPVYITGAITTFILWGIIYSSLKETNGEFSLGNKLIVIAGVVFPNALLIYFFSKYIGIPLSAKFLAITLTLIIGSIVIWLLFAMSKSMVLSIPENDEYSS